MKKLFSLFLTLFAALSLWAGNTITYTASEKLAETTSSTSSGLHTMAFYNGSARLTITSHTFTDGTGTITFSDEVTKFNNYAFYNCSDLTSVTIPASVTSIGNKAFYGCISLTSIDIPNSVTKIGDYAFSDCPGLTFIPLPESLTSIGNYAFYGCSGLTSIDIPNSVTKIGVSAFYGCTDLTTVTMKSATPPTISSTTFPDDISPLTIHIPCGSYAAYSAAQNWSNMNLVTQGSDQTITVTSSNPDHGVVTVSNDNYCTDGTVVISAIPYPSYRFTQWSDGNTDNPRTITPTQDTTFTANFEACNDCPVFKSPNIILYTDTAQLSETTGTSAYGLHTNAFYNGSTQLSIINHTFANGRGFNSILGRCHLDWQ